MLWQPGKLIYKSKYKIEEHLGSGGFADTYRAWDTKLNRQVVIKTPNINVQKDPNYVEYIKRFKKEDQIIKKCCVNNPHIVQRFEFFEENRSYCLVMEYIHGGSLWNLVRRNGALKEIEALKYISQIGLALQKIHQKKILHLDGTPLNIMIGLNYEDPTFGKAVLIDFGISAADMSLPSSFSRSFGNKAFAPYEFLHKSVRHPTVDVYCLAASLYYTVTGKCPTNSFERKYNDEKLIPPKQLVYSLSDVVNNAILQGMALEAKDRPQTMQEWLNLLKLTPDFDSVNKSQTVTQTFKDKILQIQLHIKNIFTTQPSPELKPSATPPRLWFSSVAMERNSNENRIYYKLENLLKDKKWQQADEETIRLILQLADREEQGWLDVEHINNLLFTDLRIINQAWVRHSNKRFGFSVQKRIWLECGGKVDYKTECLLGDRVGWRNKGAWLGYSDLDFSQNAPVGHLPSRVVVGGLAGSGLYYGRFDANLLWNMLSRQDKGLTCLLLSRPDL
ncbi:serine/threonine-protein kinase [Halotia branconii]|uniref:Serine/threonine-protein kinase n=1 Tax=Halotia branconii CENA392 TaxID=1539056 RepID=A0AAJ6PC77_9CYAN|nr:serine/threonine-protein kinase [Halotia branconii]WGV28601.1 serine/threonine-protein kinase [Halotia branconii CENA392]